MMDNFTYETEDRLSELETYEWDNVWWEQAPDQTKPRVLYIGDSISCGIRQAATKYSGSKILFDGFGTSKAVDNAYYADSLHLYGKQQRMRKIVIFNNGLHGFHLSDMEQYKFHYEKMVNFLIDEFKGSIIALVLTTNIAGPRKERIIARNNVVREIAEKYDLPVIDLFTASAKNAELLSADGIHYTAEGYEKLAEEIVESIYRIVPGIQY